MSRHFISLCLSLILASISYSAGAFEVEAVQNLTPNQVTATVCNSDNDQAMTCGVTTYGLTQTGIWVNSWANLVIAPGACGYAYVYATYPFYFVDSNATTDCSF